MLFLGFRGIRGGLTLAAAFNYKLNGFIEIFFGKVGREVQFVVEGGSKGQSSSDPPKPKKQHDGSDKEGEESERNTELEWEKMRKQ